MEDSASVQPWVLEYLDAQQTLTLATASPRGVPHAATLLYVHDGLAISSGLTGGVGDRAAPRTEPNGGLRDR